MVRSVVFASLLAAAGVALLVLFLVDFGGKGVPPPRDTGNEPARAPAEEPASPEPEKEPRPEEVAAADAIAGRVLREDGRPLWRARVRCMLGPYVELAATATDRDGRFRFEGLDPKTVYSIEASSRTHAPERADNVEVGTTDLTFTLTRGGDLEGTVYSADVGMPLSSFTVTLRGPENRTLAFEGASGSFKIEGLEGGRYMVQVSADGYGDSPETAIVVEDGKVVRQNFLLPPLR